MPAGTASCSSTSPGAPPAALPAPADQQLMPGGTDKDKIEFSTTEGFGHDTPGSWFPLRDPCKCPIWEILETTRNCQGLETLRVWKLSGSLAQPTCHDQKR